MARICIGCIRVRLWFCKIEVVRFIEVITKVPFGFLGSWKGSILVQPLGP